MDKFTAVFSTIMLSLFVGLIVFAITDVVHDTEHIYWANNKVEAIGEAVEYLVENPSDSLVVTHPNNPYPIGIIRFEKK